MDAEKIFSFDTLLDQLRKYGKFGLIMASIFLPLLTGDDGSNPDMEALAQNMQGGMKLEADVFVPSDHKMVLNKRLRDVAADMVKYEYI